MTGLCASDSVNWQIKIHNPSFCRTMSLFPDTGKLHQEHYLTFPWLLTMRMGLEDDSCYMVCQIWENLSGTLLLFHSALGAASVSLDLRILKKFILTALDTSVFVSIDRLISGASYSALSLMLLSSDLKFLFNNYFVD